MVESKRATSSMKSSMVKPNVVVGVLDTSAIPHAHTRVKPSSSNGVVSKSATISRYVFDILYQPHNGCTVLCKSDRLTFNFVSISLRCFSIPDFHSLVHIKKVVGEVSNVQEYFKLVWL